MKRVLCITATVNAGGAETFLMKIYRQMDRSAYQMDFCINVPEKCFYEDEILALGGKVYRIPPKSDSVKQFRKQLLRVIRENGYQYVLRITSNAAGFMDLKIAHQAGARVCAARSSNSSDGGSFKAFLSHKMGRFLYGKYVNLKIAPSDLAAIYTFGKKAYKNGQVHMLHNAIDLGVYQYDAEQRKKLRSEFHISDDMTVIGHVGRFMQQKNHEFLLDVFLEFTKLNKKGCLMLVGKGELEEQVRRKAESLGLMDKVIFTGVRPDVPALLSAMDVFAFPSFYEGMPNTVIEAQATGLPCVISDTITRDVNITGLVEYLPLQNAKYWAETLLKLSKKQRADTKKAFLEHHYDIESTCHQFVELIFGDKI